MENITQIANNKLSSWLKLTPEEKKQKGVYKSDLFRMFDYPDGTNSIVLPRGYKINVGDDFRDHKGRLHMVTEIVAVRPHKGIFDEESLRLEVGIVNSEIIPGV